MNQQSQVTAPEGATPAEASRAWRLWALATRWMLWLVAGLWVVFILTWFVLQAWIVPRIGEWRPELEAWATRAVGVPVTIGSVRASPAPQRVLPPLVPSFDITDVRLLDAQGRVALHLPSVQGALSVASLWRGRFEQILVERPVLDVRRRADGHIEIAGMALTGQGDADTAAADWFFDQTEFVVRGGTVRWTDDRRDLPPLHLSDVDVVARNGARSHDLRLDATPEPAWGERFSLRARLREPLFDLRPLRGERGAPWARWSGEVHGDWPRVDVSRLRTRVDLPAGVDVRSGDGRLRAWARLRDGRFDNLTLETDLRAVDLQLGADLPALALDAMSGRVDADWDDQGMAVATRDLRFRTRDGLEWPGGSLRVEHRLARPRQGAGTTVEADGIELEALAALAGRVPLPPDARDLLARFAPRGRLEGVRLQWQARGSGPGAQRTLMQGRGRVADLWLAGEPSGRLSRSGSHPLPGRPGVERATVEFDIDQDGGQARVSVREGALLLPDVFEQPRIAIAELEARGRWRRQGERIEVDIDDLRVRNDDMQGSAQGRWHTGDPATSPAGGALPGVLDLTARLVRADATAVHRYLPLSVPAEARRYVREAVRGGQATDVSLRLQGELWDMPLAQAAQPGIFRIEARLDGLDMDYVPAALRPPGEPGWPGVRGARARLLLDRTALQITGIEGAVAGTTGLRVSEGQVDIPDLLGDTRVDVAARVAGPAADALGFVQRSPLDALTAGALARARIGGSTQVGLRLQLPLADLAASRVSGTVRLDGNDLRITPESPPLSNARATITFTDRGFAFTGARAQLLGGELVFDGSLRNDAQAVPRLQFRGQGTASAAALREQAPAPLARLLVQAGGSTAYTAQLGFRDGVPELLVTSNLQGLALSLPAPLNKPAADSWPLRWESVAAAPGERLRLQVGPPSALLIDLEAERDGARLRSASLAVGPGAVRAPLPVQGVVAQLQVAEVDADAWQAVLGDAPAMVLPAGEALPLWVSLRADRVQARGYRFQRVVLGASRTGAPWRANIDADELNGYLEYRPGTEGQPGTVFARLARLTLSPGAPREVEQLLQQPRSVPALDIAVDDLRWADRALGRVEVQAVNRVGAPDRAPEWRLNALKVTVPEARLSATGNWAPLGASADGGAAGAARRTALVFRLDVDDSGALLERFGRAGLLRGGKGRLQGSIGWLGSPLSLDHASLGGTLQTEIERGQFLKADAGAGRLLGVLSLQALPRRLALDFRDVFSEGFAFDFLRGDARIEQGILFTNNLQMKGVNAAVLMEGTADLAREQQDLKVVVVPELNAGTASLIATAINPAVGLGSFLAQFVLRQPLQSAATQEFHITGSWADPQVAKVERTPPAAAPAAPAGNPLQ